MRVFVAGASGAIGTRLVSAADRSRARGDRHLQLARPAPSAYRRSGRTPVAARSARRARRARRRAGSRARRDRPSGDRARECALLEEPGSRVRRRRTGSGPRARTRCSPPRARQGCAGSSPRASRACDRRARARWSRPRTIRSIPPRCRSARESQRRDAPSRPRRSQAPAGSRCATAASMAQLERRADRARAQAAVPDRRRRRRSLLVHPPRRRRRGDRARARTRLGAGIYNVVDDEPAPVRDWLPVLASGARREAAPPRPPLARPARSRATSRSRWEPIRAAPRTRRPSASWAGSRATRAGEKASRPSTRQPPRRRDADPTRPPGGRSADERAELPHRQREAGEVGLALAGEGAEEVVEPAGRRRRGRGGTARRRRAARRPGSRAGRTRRGRGGP